MRRPRRYDRDYAAYPADYRRPLIPDPWGGLYPPVEWGGGIFYGLEGGGPSPFELYGLSPYDYAYDTRRPPDAALRRPPRESSTFGRRADAAARRWAREHGYDAGYAMRPRTAGGRYRWRGHPARHRRRGGRR
ncbi:MAG: hypothetical protein GWN71_30285 [Gammaproteobacteria bacterium]|nr:hypothetical protein [Gemmatimonadota bacterium]NIU77686.1 hypothetical protein [Gammaproteobacteria bacterium]